jgi:hypothetical protein
MMWEKLWARWIGSSPARSLAIVDRIRANSLLIYDHFLKRRRSVEESLVSPEFGYSYADQSAQTSANYLPVHPGQA